MTDRTTSFDPAAIAEGDELVFDDVEMPPAPPPSRPKRPKTGRSIAAAEIGPAAAPMPAAAAAPEPAMAAAAPDVAPHPASILSTRLIAVALALSLFTSTVSCIGLLVASRTIAHADHARDAAEAQTAQLAHLPATLERIDRLVAREQAALAARAQGRAGQPATVGDLQHGLDRLRTAITERQPQRDQEIITITKAGQSEIAERLGAISDVVDRLGAAQIKARGGR